jgi:hypothetical protein
MLLLRTPASAEEEEDASAEEREDVEEGQSAEEGKDAEENGINGQDIEDEPVPAILNRSRLKLMLLCLVDFGLATRSKFNHIL